MTSTRTDNRKRKIDILKECQSDLVTILLMDSKDRDGINMSRFKELHRIVKDILEQGNSMSVDFTKDSKN